VPATCILDVSRAIGSNQIKSKPLCALLERLLVWKLESAGKLRTTNTMFSYFSKKTTTN
jgi:hypothetical protein